MSQNPIGVNGLRLPSGARRGQAAGPLADGWVSQLHGSKYYQATGGRLFRGANQTGATISNALATTYTGLCLSNPAGSGKELILRRVAGLMNAAPTGVIVLGLISGYALAGVVTHTTALTIRSSKVGVFAPTPVGKLDAACTLVGTPAWYDWFTNPLVADQLTRFEREYEGGLVIQPGAYVAVGSFGSAGTTTAFLGSMEWEEADLV